MTDSVELKSREESHDDGTPLARWTVRVVDGEDVLHGKYESFHRNGMKAERRFYEDGEPAGIWARWDDTGRQLFEGPPTTKEDEDIAEPSAEDWDAPFVEEDPNRTKIPWGEWGLELGVVIVLGWLMYFATAMTSEAIWTPREDWINITEKDDFAFGIYEMLAMAASIQVLIPLLWIIHRSSLSWADVGIVKPKIQYWLLLGAALPVMTIGLDALLVRVFDLPDPPGWYPEPATWPLWLVLILAMVLNSLTEEFVWRGYALKRLTQMSGSKAFALILSSFLFATYHIYQGFENMLLALLFGIVMGISVLVTRRIWPAVVAHTLHNLFLYTEWADELFGTNTPG